jgi:hypothetical protein
MHCTIQGSKDADLINAKGRTSPIMELRFVDEHGADRTSISVSAWLAEVREMRGRVFYEEGRRTFFRLADGSFHDSDPADLHAYHVIARSQGHAVGCARVLPLDVGLGYISFTIGIERLEHILQDLGVTRGHACEAARWAVVREWRGGLGPRIVAASWAVARWLGFDVALVLSCTCEKQDLALIRLGASPIRDLPLFPSRISDDELRLLYFDVSHPTEWMRNRMDEEAAALNLVGGMTRPPLHEGE